MVNMAQKIAGGAQAAAIAVKNSAVAVATNPKVVKVAKYVLIATVAGAVIIGAVLLTKKAITAIQAYRADRAEQKRRDEFVAQYGVAGKAYLKAGDFGVAAKEKAGQAAKKAQEFAKEHQNALLIGAFGTLTLGTLIHQDTFGINSTVADYADTAYKAVAGQAEAGYNAVASAATNGYNYVSELVGFTKEAGANVAEKGVEVVAKSTEAARPSLFEALFS